jgi:hypothetical protein
MSYDVYVNCSCCGQDLIAGGRNNMTSNIAGVWNKAGAPLRDWGGKRAMEVLPMLQNAITTLKNLDSWERPEYEELVRGGGTWGKFEDAIEYLELIRDACCRDPLATLSVGH